VTRWL